MGPKSFVELCTNMCIANVGLIADIGDLPYHRARPILLKVESASQLRDIEMASPQIQGETEEIWRKLIARQFPGWEKKNYYPKNPLSWYRVYDKYKREYEAELAEAEAKLKAAFKQIESDAEGKKGKIVSQRLLPRPPRDGYRQSNGRARNPVPASGGSKILLKAKREARDLYARRVLSTPTGQLRVPQGQIKKAPPAMIYEHQIRNQPEIRVRAPRSINPRKEAEEAERKLREERLLKIKHSTSTTRGQAPQMVWDSDSGDDASEPSGHSSPNGESYLAALLGEEEDDDDLFGDGAYDEGEDDNEEQSTPSARPSILTTRPASSSAPTHKSTSATTSSPQASREKPPATSTTAASNSGVSNKKRHPLFSDHLLSSKFNPTFQKRVVRTAEEPPTDTSKPIAAKQPGPSADHPPSPTRNLAQRSAPQSSPPLRPQTASSPPLGRQSDLLPSQVARPGGTDASKILRMNKRKPQGELFPKPDKKPRT